MKIKKLRIFNNYRRFHDLTIDLGDDPKRIITLVGPNGCGKSSVFDAMIYRSGFFGSRIGNSDAREKTYHFMSGYEDNDHKSIEMVFNNGKEINKVIHETKGWPEKIHFFLLEAPIGTIAT